MSVEERWEELASCIKVGAEPCVDLEHVSKRGYRLVNWPDSWPCTVCTKDAARALALAPLRALFDGYACDFEDQECPCDIHMDVRPLVEQIEALT